MADARLSIVGVFQDRISKKLNNVQRSVDGVKSAVTGTAARLSAAFGAGVALRGIVQTNAEFDRLEAQIRTFSDSAEEAEAAMRLIQDVTRQTPFQINEVTEAFSRMKALGLDPSRESLMAFGDVAAGSGRSVLQFTEAVADAAVGEFERLKEFGIRASKEGDRVRFTFKGVTEEVQFSSQAIQGYLTELGQQQFGGAMAAQMDTFSGAISNAKDSFALLARAIGEAGLNAIITQLAKTVGGFAQFMLDTIPKVKAVFIGMGTNIVRASEEMRHALAQFANRTRLVFAQFFDFVSGGWNSLIETLSRGINALAGVVPGLQRVNVEALKYKTNTEEIAAAIEREAAAHERNVRLINEGWAARMDSLEAAEGINQAEKTYEQILSQKNAAIEQSNRVTKQNTDIVEDNTKAKEDNAKATAHQKTVYEQTIEDIKEQRIEYQQTKEALVKIEEAYQRGEITAKEYASAVERLNYNIGITKTKTEELKQETKKVGESWEEAEQKAAQSTQSMSSSFGDLLNSLITGAGSISSSLSGFISSIFSRLFSGTSSGGSSGGFLSGIASAIGGLFRAEGGPVQANQPYIWNERGRGGPEVFIPRTSGMVFSDKDTRNMMQGMAQGPSTVNINVTAMDGADALNVLSRHRREITEMVLGTQRTLGID